MADLKATVIYQYGDLLFGRVTLPKKTAADAIEIGDFLVWDASNDGVEKVDAAADDATFVGISGCDSADADGVQDILVYTQAIVEVPAESAQYKFGAGLLYNTNGTVADDAGANTIGWVWEKDTGASATSVKMYFNTASLAKLFEVNA